jgi:uncharacterized repeat protein (TIGR01451 family)
MFWDGLAHEFEDQTINAIYIDTEADLFVEKVDAVDPVVVGDIVTYFVTVSNDGLEVATSVVLVDTLPDSVSFVSATPDQGTCSQAGWIVTCVFLDIASGASVGVTIQAKTTRQGVITNNVRVAWENRQNNAFINSASEHTTVSMFQIFLPTIQR